VTCRLQEIIHATLNDHLGGKLYEAQKVSNWSKNIADSVKSQVKTLGYERSVQPAVTGFTGVITLTNTQITFSLSH
jgi:hypothetical protein